jgi:hypothetical protein
VIFVLLGLLISLIFYINLNKVKETINTSQASPNTLYQLNHNSCIPHNVIISMKEKRMTRNMIKIEMKLQSKGRIDCIQSRFELSEGQMYWVKL